MTRATTQTASRGDDFPSWLSPMVVKELRQGVQSGAFAWTFIGLQGAMFLLMSWALTAFDPSNRVTDGMVQGLFWLLVAVGVLFVLPLRGLGAISSERVGNNLDLVRLTRLSATRIVLGKWLAIVAQCALLVAAILPYLVLRYFFGGVNVVRDLEVISWLFAGSMVVTAAALALSTLPLWVRIAAGAVAAPVTFGSLIGFIERGGGTFGRSERLGVLAVLVLYTVVLLEYSASRIAPVAENHAVRKRMIALIVAGVWLVVVGWAGARAAGWTMAATLPLLVVYAIEAILERPVHLVSQAAAFTRCGLPGRLAARLLLPGWATGLAFVVVLAAPCLTAWWTFVWRHTRGGEQLAAAAMGPLLMAAVVFPLPAVVYLRRVRYRLLLYALVQLICFMVFIYTNAMKPYGIEWRDWPLGWGSMLPLPVAAIGSLMASLGNGEVGLASLVASAAVTAIVCLSVAWPWLGEMRQTGRTIAAARTARAARAARESGGALA